MWKVFGGAPLSPGKGFPPPDECPLDCPKPRLRGRTDCRIMAAAAVRPRNVHSLADTASKEESGPWCRRISAEMDAAWGAAIPWAPGNPTPKTPITTPP